MQNCETSAPVPDVDGASLLPLVDGSEEGDRLAFCGPSLFAALATADGVHVREVEWWASSDLGEVTGRTLRVWGREEEYLKVGGEGVHLGPLRAVLEKALEKKLLARENRRLRSELRVTVDDRQ